MKKKRSAGFSMLEILIGGVVVAVLAGISMNRFGAWSGKSKRAEAHLGLRAVHEAQMVHYLRTGIFADSFNKLEFSMVAGRAVTPTEYAGGRYTFQLSQPNGRKSWRCTATGNIDADPWMDVVVAWDERVD